MKTILILVSFVTVIIAAPFGFIFEMLSAGFYYRQGAAQKLAGECREK